MGNCLSSDRLNYETEKARSNPPELTELGIAEISDLIENFKRRLLDESNNVIDSVLGDYYNNLPAYINSDAWTSFRSQVIDGIINYDQHESSRYDFKRLRADLLKNHRSELTADLNTDLLEENKRLQERIDNLQERQRSSF